MSIGSPPSPSDDALGCLWAGAFFGLVFLAAVLAWNAFVVPPPGFAP